MYSWGHNRNCCMLSVFENHVFIYMLHWNIRVFWKVFFSINFSLFERENTSFWGVFSLFFGFSPSIHNMESGSSIFPLYFSLFSFSHYKLWSGSIFLLCAHMSDLLWLIQSCHTQKSFRSICCILALWGRITLLLVVGDFWEDKQYVCQSKLGGARMLD